MKNIPAPLERLRTEIDDMQWYVSLLIQWWTEGKARRGEPTTNAEFLIGLLRTSMTGATEALTLLEQRMTHGSRD